jgi:Cof subfamily protein (haloacid dehalogenase superfamily)
MPIRLLALDLDGTLLNSHGKVSSRTRQALGNARERQVSIALVTGRRFRDARPLALDLDLDLPLISHNGALTKHARTLEVVEKRLLPFEAAKEVLKIGRLNNADALVSDDPAGKGVLVYDRLSDDNPALAKYIEWSIRIHGDEASEAIRRVESLEDYLDHSPVHIAFSGAYQRMLDLSETLRRELDGTVKVLSTLYPKLNFALIDVLHPGASKGVGVAAAAMEKGIGREEVMAIGDNLNDLEMLQYAGTPVVMGNAEGALFELPGVLITATNDEDGVAKAIEELILEVG